MQDFQQQVEICQMKTSVESDGELEELNKSVRKYIGLKVLPNHRIIFPGSSQYSAAG